MADFRAVTDAFSVSSQLTIEDLKLAAERGFKTIICNRPDNEERGQAEIATLKAEAESLGLRFLVLPFSGGPTPEIADQQGILIANAENPVLAYCRSGTRSIAAWALSQRGTGQRDTILNQAADAGYDLRSLAAAL
ncbi:MAG: TIGR01244 family sulfur transferase [Pseudomonadota bacterium]